MKFFRTLFAVSLLVINTDFTHASDLSVFNYDLVQNKYVQLSLPPDELAVVLEIKNGILENRYFKVVEGQGNTPLTIEDLDGRNVLFHLMQARKFFENLDKTNPCLNSPAVIRVRVRNNYNFETHFAETESFNNSRFINKSYRGEWINEIWFHVRRKSNSDSGMDLAKVPSVIAHEAFHWATDDPYPFNSNTDGNPIKEDFANYFGSVYEGRPIIAKMDEYVDAKRARDFSGIHPVEKSGTGKLTYNFSNFIPSFLWSYRKQLSNPERFDQYVWNVMALTRATTNYVELSALFLSEAQKEFGVNSDLTRRIEFGLRYHQISFENLDWVFSLRE